MKKILSYRDQRILKISEQLILNSKRIAIEDIMKINRCSLKTVYEDIEFLEEAWGEILDIQVSIGSIYSPNTSIADLMMIKRSIYNHTLAVRICLSLYCDGAQSIQELSQSLHYSASKIRKEIISCNELLEDLKIKIISKDAKYMVVGSDNRVLAYLAALAVLGSGYPEEIYHNYETLIEKSNLEEKIGFKIPSIIRDEILLADYFYQWHHGQEVDDYYCSMLTKEIEKDISQIIASHHLKVDELVPIVTKIVRSMYFKMTTFQQDNLFYMHRYYYFYYLFRLENKKFVEHYEESLISLEEKWKIPILSFKEELLFLLYVNIPDIRAYRKCKIAVHSDLGRGHAQVLIERLRKNFSSHCFSVFDEEERYHLILSTSKHALLEKVSDVPVLEISDLITSYDYYTIYKMLYHGESNCEEMPTLIKRKRGLKAL